jgi:hypothetical protein
MSRLNCMIWIPIGLLALSRAEAQDRTEAGRLYKVTARDNYSKTQRDLVVHRGDQILVRLAIPSGTRYELDRDHLKGIVQLEKDGDGEILRDMPRAQKPSQGPRVGGDRIFIAKFRGVEEVKGEIALNFDNIPEGRQITYRVRVKVEAPVKN